MTAVPTVLVVDDEEYLVDLYSAWLEDSYAVRTAHSGGEALERIDDVVDAVLLDRRMPALTGGEVLDELRARGHECTIAIVSGLPPDDWLLERSVHAYLRKPVDREQVREVADALVGDDGDDPPEIPAIERAATTSGTGRGQLSRLGESDDSGPLSNGAGRTR